MGSFAAAADKMNRSQSTISYAISRLQDQFKTPLLEMKGRKAHLTEAGKALLAEAEPLLRGFRALEERAESLANGDMREIRFSVDSIYPDDRLFTALAELIRRYPHVLPKLRKTTFMSSVREFANFEADMCITGFRVHEPFVKPILDIRMQAVVRADHPLNDNGRQLAHADLSRHLAVVIEGTENPEIEHQPLAESQRFLAVNTIEAAIEAVRSGLCFGWLPLYRISPYLESGELARLRLPLSGERIVRLFLVAREMSSPNGEESYIADLLGANGEVEVL